MKTSTKAGLAMIGGGMIMAIWYMISKPDSAWSYMYPAGAITVGWITCAEGWQGTSKLFGKLVALAAENFLVQGIALGVVGYGIFGSDMDFGDFDAQHIGALLFVLGMVRILWPALKWTGKMAEKKAGNSQ